MSSQITTLNSWSSIPEIIAYVGTFAAHLDLGRFAQVSKDWNEAMSSNTVWEKCYENNEIPYVYGNDRNLKNDFMVLYPITLSGKTIRKWFGKIEGEIPCMNPEKFKALVTKDDPWRKGTKMHRTFKVIVDPAHIIRPYDKGLFKVLAKNGDPAEIIPTTEGAHAAEMRIPFSLRNRKVLVDHLLAGHKNEPIFNYFRQEVLDQCNLPITKTALYVMRKEVVGQNLPYVGEQSQQDLVERHHLEITPLAIRVLFDTIEILESGTCPDKKGDPLWTYARTSNVVRLDGSDFPVAIGGFAPGCGLIVGSDYEFARTCNGVAPGAPAEVRSF